MHHDQLDTIAAIATAPEGAARGIVRISGPDALSTVTKLLETADRESLLAAKTSIVVPAAIRLDDLERTLQADLYVWPNARSYTREPVVEIHMIGSPPLLQVVLRSVCQCGARLAKPGEFTMRAFLAGRLDLAQAEAVLGVIDARDRRQLDRALSQLAGGVGQGLREIRSQLIDLLAELEAGLDFVEEDIEFISAEQLQNSLKTVLEQLQSARRRLSQRGTADEAIRIVLSGKPNAGKSSLFNALIASERALVSDIAGTTRDYVVARFDLDGAACELVDTAGVEDDSMGMADMDEISGAAREMSLSQSSSADIRLACADIAAANVEHSRDFRSDEIQLIPKEARGPLTIAIHTKCDLGSHKGSCTEVINTSSLTGAGLDELRAALSAAVQTIRGGKSDSGSISIHSGECLRLADESLRRALELSQQQSQLSEDLVAAELRVALVAVGEVTGEVHSDEILDRVFSRFCIGK